MKICIGICFLIILLNSSAAGKDNSLTLQTPTAYATGSCIDRCHVNYLSYRTKYKKDIFLHKNHSSLQNIECYECHNNDPVNTKTHGGLIINENDCKICHHKEAKNEDCLKCHSEVNDYRNGSFPYEDINYTDMKTPDWMYKAVLCTDCHKKEENNFLFQDIRNLCIECHNDDYGLLYDKWKELLQAETQPDIMPDMKSSTTYRKTQPFDSAQGDCECHAERSRSIINDELQKIGNAPKKSAKMQSYLKHLQQYGIHNIRLSQILLKRIQKEKDNSAKK